MPISPDFAAFQALLDDECAALSAFVTALDEEQQTLARSADVSALQPIVDRKSSLYQRLTTIGRARTAWLSTAGFGSMPAVLDAARASSDTGGAVVARWDEIVALAKVAQRSNETNGRLVRTRMSYNRAALDSIRAAQGTTLSVYGADGRM